MATGRTHYKHARVYADGYEWSCGVTGLSPLIWEYEEVPFMSLCDEAKGVLPGQSTITPGSTQGIMDNTATTGLHILASGIASPRDVMIPIGIRAAPAAGDPVFCGKFYQLAYYVAAAGGDDVTINWGAGGDAADLQGYDNPWGMMLHAKGAETAANTGTGVTNVSGQTTLGGYLMYQVFAGNGTATISVDDSANNSSFAALSGATTGSISCATPSAGIIELSKTATVRQYLRWQIALGTATTVTFALAFVRGIRS